MPQFLWLVVAFLAGVLIEWLFEIFLFRRRTFEQVEAERTRHELASLEWTGKNATLQASISHRDRELEAARAASSTLESDLAAYASARGPS